MERIITGYRDRGKKIIYLLFKRPNRKLWEFRCGRGGNVDHANLEILRGLRKKGLVAMAEYPSGNIYYLTDKGDEIAKPIVDKIDEYKRW